MRKLHSNNQGFTIVELMIATIIATTIMLIATTGMMQIARIYYKGVTSARTQESARLIMEDITESIRFQGYKVKQAVDGANRPYKDYSHSGSTLRVMTMCVGSHRYSYTLLNRLDSTQNTNPTANVQRSRHVLVKDVYSDKCDIATASVNLGQQNLNIPPSNKSREMLGPNMRLEKLSITPYDTTDPSNLLWKVEVTVITGQTDLLIGTPGSRTCRSSYAGTQFCAVASLSTVVAARLQ